MNKELFKEKKARVIKTMAAREVIKAAEEAKQILWHPHKVGSIDLKEVSKLNAKIHNLEVDPGLEKTGFLFFYNSKYLFVDGNGLKNLSEAEVNEMLVSENKIKIYIICLQVNCDTPDILVDKSKTTMLFKNDQEVANFITKTTGVDVKVTDL